MVKLRKDSVQGNMKTLLPYIIFTLSLVPAEKMLENQEVVAFSPDHIIFPAFIAKMIDYKKAVTIDYAKQIKAGDFYGHYRIIKYKDGTHAALYHHGDFGGNQYYPCFCKLEDNVYEISGTIRIFGVSHNEGDGKKRERILVLKIHFEN
jgi:hypothetical protein